MALGQVRTEYEEIVHRLAREIDFGREMQNMLVTLGRKYGAASGEASHDPWKVLIDKPRRRRTTKSKRSLRGKESGLRSSIPMVHRRIGLCSCEASKDIDAPGGTQKRGRTRRTRGDAAGQNEET